MSSGADLFVVCKQCGSEVSPYITECPYCGHRLRRRAPALPPANAPVRKGVRGRARSWLGRSGPGSAGARKRTIPRHRTSRHVGVRPYATIALVAASCVMWVLVHAKPDLYLHTAVL